jgi:hypothetical protein
LVIGGGNEGDVCLVAASACSQHEVFQRAAEADMVFASDRVKHRQLSGRVGVEVDCRVGDMKRPRLGVVRVRCQDRCSDRAERAVVRGSGFVARVGVQIDAPASQCWARASPNAMSESSAVSRSAPPPPSAGMLVIAEKLLGQNHDVAAIGIDTAQIKGVLPLPL